MTPQPPKNAEPDPEALRCERCDAPGAQRLGERILCEACYFACNSCCGEFGADDRSPE